MKTNTPPTIGRKLWLWNVYGQKYDAKQPFDASVCYVWNPTAVNVTFFDHSGAQLNATSIEVHDPGPDGGPAVDYPHATWMPYQAQQHARSGQVPQSDKEPS